MKKGECVLISEGASGQGRFNEEMGLLEGERNLKLKTGRNSNEEN